MSLKPIKTVGLLAIIAMTAGCNRPQPAVDSGKQPAPPAEQPAVKAAAPKYCQVKVGPEGKTRLWLVDQGSKLLTHANEKGDDLTGAKTVEPTGAMSAAREFKVGEVAPGVSLTVSEIRRDGAELVADLGGGSVFIYEADPERGKAPDAAELAAQLKKRIDPEDVKNVTVRPAPQDGARVEVLLPGPSEKFSQEEVDKLVKLLRSGELPPTLRPQPVSEITVGRGGAPKGNKLSDLPATIMRVRAEVRGLGRQSARLWFDPEAEKAGHLHFDGPLRIEDVSVYPISDKEIRPGVEIGLFTGVVTIDPDAASVVSLEPKSLPEGTRPVVEIEFPAADPKGKPLSVKVPLKDGDDEGFRATVKVPDGAGAGKAMLKARFDAPGGRKVEPRKQDFEVKAAAKK